MEKNTLLTVYLDSCDYLKKSLAGYTRTRILSISISQLYWVSRQK